MSERSSRPPTIEQLRSGEYRLLAALSHARMAEFLIEYFLRRGTWLTRLHHAMSVATLGAIVWVSVARGTGWLYGVKAFGLAFVALFVIILPLHELLHAVAYRMTGARDVRWDYSVRMLAVWVIAHHFVEGTRAFVFVALLPFVVLNALLLAGAVVFEEATIFLLFVLLWHLHGASGDWALLNFCWIHRGSEVWTYDDAERGESYFYG